MTSFLLNIRQSDFISFIITTVKQTVAVVITNLPKLPWD